MPAGRPSDYNKVDLYTVTKLCKLGFTDKKIAEFYEVSEQTVNTWKKKYPEFLESLKAGKAVADAEVANSLYHRAVGYACEDTHISIFKGVITKTPVIKQYPPDTAAAFIWLKNRQPEIWRDRQEIEHKGDVVPVIFSEKVKEHLENAGDDL